MRKRGGFVPQQIRSRIRVDRSMDEFLHPPLCYFAFTSICFGFASSAFGKVI
jgi:hypothetical protein